MQELRIIEEKKDNHSSPIEIKIVTEEDCPYCDPIREIIKDLVDEMPEIDSFSEVNTSQMLETYLYKLKKRQFPLTDARVTAGKHDFILNDLMEEKDGNELIEGFLKMVFIKDGKMVFPAEIFNVQDQELGDVDFPTPMVFLFMDGEHYLVNNGMFCLSDDMKNLDIDETKKMIRETIEKYLKNDPNHVEKLITNYDFDTLEKL